jgi:AcrR family transcriptional regulator
MVYRMGSGSDDVDPVVPFAVRGGVADLFIRKRLGSGARVGVLRSQPVTVPGIPANDRSRAPMRSGGLTASSLRSTAYTAAQTRIIEAALDLFAEHGIGGTSLQMIADALGVTKAAIYHQYNTKDEIILAVAQVVLARLEAAVTAAEAERSRPRAREVLITAMIDLAVERRRMAGILQRDPVMLRFLENHEPFRHVMVRVNRLLMGGASHARSRVQAATLAAAIAGAVTHPLVLDLDDESLRSQLLKQARKLLSLR